MAKTSSKKAPKGVTLALHPRPGSGTSAARAERRAGRIPAVVYGHGSEPLPVSVEAKALAELIGTGRRNQLIDAQVDGHSDTVLLRDVQRDPITRSILHADFQRVSRTEKIHATLPVVPVGVSPGVKDFGRVPEHLEVDISGLGIHDHITAAEVKLPPDFSMVTPGGTIVISIEPSRTEREAVETAPTEQAPAAEASTPQS